MKLRYRLMAYGVVIAIVWGGFWYFKRPHQVPAPPPPPAATAAAPYPSVVTPIPTTSSMTKKTKTSKPIKPSSSTKKSAVAPSATVSPSATASAACYPTWVKIPSIGLSQSIKPMGLNVLGQIEPLVKQAMWYDQKGDSTIPGKPGIALFAGHVTYNNVPDSFYHLARVKKGATIIVDCSDGSSLTFRVTAAPASINKLALEDDPRVWGGSSTPKLDLVTCDPDSGKRKDGHYYNNTLVQASLVG